MKKAILINAKAKTVTVVEIGEGIDDIYKHLECRAFDIVGVEENVDCYVDDEGLLTTGYIDDDGEKHNMNGFKLPSCGDSVLMGNGLVLGCNPETGDSVDCPVTVEQVEKVVTFVEYDNPDNRPEPKIVVTGWDF